MIAHRAQLVRVTNNGQTWNLVESPSSLLRTNILTNGQRGLLVVPAPSDSSLPTIATVGDDLTVTLLTQTGDGPVGMGFSPEAVGPTGVVVLSPDTRFVPDAAARLAAG